MFQKDDRIIQIFIMSHDALELTDSEGNSEDFHHGDGASVCSGISCAAESAPYCFSVARGTT
jgi:hypothetical protein